MWIIITVRQVNWINSDPRMTCQTAGPISRRNDRTIFGHRDRLQAVRKFEVQWTATGHAKGSHAGVDARTHARTHVRTVRKAGGRRKGETLKGSFFTSWFTLTNWPCTKKYFLRWDKRLKQTKRSRCAHSWPRWCNRETQGILSHSRDGDAVDSCCRKNAWKIRNTEVIQVASETERSHGQ